VGRPASAPLTLSHALCIPVPRLAHLSLPRRRGAARAGRPGGDPGHPRGV